MNTQIISILLIASLLVVSISNLLKKRNDDRIVIKINYARLYLKLYDVILLLALFFLAIPEIVATHGSVSFILVLFLLGLILLISANSIYYFYQFLDLENDRSLEVDASNKKIKITRNGVIVLAFILNLFIKSFISSNEL